MIASVIRLSRSDYKALGIRDAYGIHKLVYSLFPQQVDATRDFLYADKGGDWQTRQILMLSERAPLKSEYGEIESREIPATFLEYDHYGFEVTVNAVRRNGPTKKTMPILGNENLLGWFREKAPEFGFEVDTDNLQVTKVGVVRFEKNKAGKTFRQTHNTATFIGRLTVTDRQLFITSFKEGIGRAKGFGFGLLQIVPLNKYNNEEMK